MQRLFLSLYEFDTANISIKFYKSYQYRLFFNNFK